MEPTVYIKHQQEIAEHFITYLQTKDSVGLSQTIMQLQQPSKFVGVTELVVNLNGCTEDDKDRLRSSVALILEDTKNMTENVKSQVNQVMFSRFYDIQPLDNGHYEIGVDWDAVDEFIEQRKNAEGDAQGFSNN